MFGWAMAVYYIQFVWSMKTSAKRLGEAKYCSYIDGILINQKNQHGKH